MKTSISFLSIKENIKENIIKLDNIKGDYIHVDIMDGQFVPNQTNTFEHNKKILQNTKTPKDVHLMVNDVQKYIDMYKNLNPEFITFHLEATYNVAEMINYIKSLGIKVGISIKPNTHLELLIPYLNDIDLVLVMSVEPGFGGQEFIEDSVLKINKLYELKKIHNYNYLIEIDGGINDKTATMCSKADILVIGSFITKYNNYEEQLNKILKSLD